MTSEDWEWQHRRAEEVRRARIRELLRKVRDDDDRQIKFPESLNARRLHRGRDDETEGTECVGSGDDELRTI
jgi:hypothetical protein